MTNLTLPSPAKINRLLHIVGRRQDGYHLLQTIFQFLDLNDTLHFETRKDNQIVILPENGNNIPTETNLIFKAAQLLREQAHAPEKGVTITLEKKIPIGAGLGGGSSNAATTLFGLNQLWGLSLSLSELMAIGLQLGADVPVFIFQKSAWAEGIGEKLTPISLDEPWILLVSPPCHVPTVKMYAAPELTRNTPPVRIGTLAGKEFERVLSEAKNDFEPVARKYFPEIDYAMKWLSNFGKAQLSGSGASVFVCFESRKMAEDALQCLPIPWVGQVVKALNTSPLKKASEAA